MTGVKDAKKNTRRKRVNSLTKSSRAGRTATRRHLFDCWPEVSRVIHSAPHLALFMDFDGTLAALRPRPRDVKPLSASLRRVLRQLTRHRRVKVYVISGRLLTDLRELVPVPGVQLLGLYGWEGRDGPALEEERQLLRVGRKLLDERLSGIGQKVWVEDKGMVLAVHYRGAAPASIRRARAIVGEVLNRLGSQIHLLRGDKVWELLPRQLGGKGSAVTALLSQLPQPTFPIFAGDGFSDESAFGVLRHGLTIYVGGSRRTKARYFLQNPEEVEMFLGKLEAAIA